MVKRTSWEVKYGLQFVAGVTTDPTFASTVVIGVDVGIHGLPLTNHPDFVAGKTIIDTRKAIGIAQRRGGTGYEYQGEKLVPTVSFELEPSRKEIGALAWLLFQSGASEVGTSPFKKTYVPYVSTATGGCDCEVYCALMKDMGGGTTASEHQVIKGAICKSLAFNGTEGGAITMTAEMLGSDHLATFTEGGSYALNFAGAAPLLFKDLVFTLDGVAVNCSAFSLTISNDAISKAYNHGTTQAYILKTMTCTGSVTVPWGETGAQTQIANWLSITPVPLTFAWGTAGVDEVKISINARYTGAPIDLGGDEAVIPLAFDSVYYGSTGGIKLEVEDGVQRGIA